MEEIKLNICGSVVILKCKEKDEEEEQEEKFKSIAEWKKEINEDLKNGIGLRTIVEKIGNAKILLRIIEEIFNDDSCAIKNTMRSEHHRLGFDKLMLFEDENFTIRFHVWWKDHERKKESIHNHKFSFGSKIMHGNLCNHIYEKCDKEGDIFNEYLLLPSSNQTFDCFQSKGKTRLRKTIEFVNGTNNSYSLDHECFHIAYPQNDQEVTITLFLRSKDMKLADTMFEKEPLQYESNVENKFLSKDEYINSLFCVADYL